MSYYESIENNSHAESHEQDDEVLPDQAKGLAPLTLTYRRPDPNRTDSKIFSIQAGDYVGVIAVNELTIAIAPKIDLRHFLYIISRATDWDVLREREPTQLSLGSQPHSFLEIVATWFLDQVSRLIPDRLLSDYRRVEDYTPVVRGPINPRLTTDALLRGNLLICNSFDVFDIDTPQNRLLREALRITSLFPTLPSSVTRRAYSLYSVLDEIGPYQAGDSKAPTDRRYLGMGFAPALALARRLVSNGGHRSTRSDQFAVPFLLETYDIVETGIREILSDGLRESHEVHKRPIRYRDHKVARPDLVFTSKSDGLTVATGDVKYKLASSWTSHRGDLYQATFFATAAEVRAGCAIYFSEGRVLPDASELPGGIALHQICWNCHPDITPQESQEELLRDIDALLATVSR
jgi:5-methylcytosine-specific restriction enzyme subunit McrC